MPVFWRSLFFCCITSGFVQAAEPCLAQDLFNAEFCAPTTANCQSRCANGNWPNLLAQRRTCDLGNTSRSFRSFRNRNRVWSSTGNRWCTECRNCRNQGNGELKTASHWESEAPEVIPDPELVSSIARLILDDNANADERVAAIGTHRTIAVELVRKMVEGLENGTPEESRRIPWLWRVSRMAGESGNSKQIRGMIEMALPHEHESLGDWQTVVLGGGVVAGISAAGYWPRDVIERLIPNDEALRPRWTRSLELAAEKVENELVSHGTRYDALRLVAMAGWESAGQLLLKYLPAVVGDELQMGAINGLSDIDDLNASGALIANLENMGEYNRQQAMAGLLKGPSQTKLLLMHVKQNPTKLNYLQWSQWDSLSVSVDSEIQSLALSIIAAQSVESPGSSASKNSTDR